MLGYVRKGFWNRFPRHNLKRQITDFLVNLSLPFIADIISSLLIRYLTVHREFTQFYFVIYSLTLLNYFKHLELPF